MWNGVFYKHRDNQHKTVMSHLLQHGATVRAYTAPVVLDEAAEEAGNTYKVEIEIDGRTYVYLIEHSGQPDIEEIFGKLEDRLNGPRGNYDDIDIEIANIDATSEAVDVTEALKELAEELDRDR